ncbi:MAG: beta-N-acetylhexosaminidase [Burkholderiaceae bacterium]|jgi:beta-N-acetylhexosaminidase
MKNQPLGPLIVGIEELTLNSADERRLLSPNVGGVILFTRNFESPEQLSRLTEAIRVLRSPALLIFVDHEGGRVQRFKNGFTNLPGMRTLGREYANDPTLGRRLAIQAGYVLALELLVCGVDMSFTPVLDLNYGRSDIIGDRSFAREPVAVAEVAQALLHGLALAGMRGCGKHFPGHGWAVADSHVALPVDERPLEHILQNDAMPYAALGSLALHSVMPAHIVYDRVDAQPAGFSRVWLQDILRKRLGYHGAIISDDLGMAGAYVAGDIIARANAAFTAGCDAALVCNDFADIETLATVTLPPMSDAARMRFAGLRPIGDIHDARRLMQMADYEEAVIAVKALA